MASKRGRTERKHFDQSSARCEAEPTKLETHQWLSTILRQGTFVMFSEDIVHLPLDRVKALLMVYTYFGEAEDAAKRSHTICAIFCILRQMDLRTHTGKVASVPATELHARVHRAVNAPQLFNIIPRD